MNRAVAVAVALFAAGCGGGTKAGNTTPQANPANGQSMNDSGDPTFNGGNSGNAVGDGSGAGGADPMLGEGPVMFPNLDPDPGQAKSQVDHHLAIARQALSLPTPDADAALREAKEALKIDATSVDAAAYYAFAYYHKKQYDTAELVLDDVFKRETAKKNAGIYYVYGLVYDQTKRPEQAVLAYSKAIELNPNFPSALVNVGAHQLRNKQYAEAQSTFERLTKEFRRNDAVVLTSLGSAYRGRSGEYPAGSGDRNQFVTSSEQAYRRALLANPNYGPAYYNLALLYLDADPFPSGGGTLDTMQRLSAAKGFLDKYKDMPGVDMKMYDERMKDVTKAVKHEEKRRKKAGKGGASNP